MIQAVSGRSERPLASSPAGPPPSDGDQPCVDCFGRDVFEGSDPESPTPPVTPPSRHALGKFIRGHRIAIGLLVAAGVVTLFIVFVLPKISGLGSTLQRLGTGNHAWLAVGVGLEVISIGGYVALFRTVFSTEGTKIGWRASYEITLAGIVATKLLAAAGAGGIALTAWALRAAGLSGRTIARRMAGFEILLYTVFMVTLIVVGLALGTGVVGTQAGWSVSFLPAAFGALVIGLVLLARLVPAAFERLADRASGRRRLGKLLSRLATVPATIRDGIDTAAELIRQMKPGVLGAVVYWAFDIAALYVSFLAFGATEPVFVVIMGYYVGQLANAIPIPGGIGGVEGGMIGCFIALGVNAGAAVVAVFAYRAISFWLPTLPGALAYLQLRRRIGTWRAAEEGGRQPA